MVVERFLRTHALIGLADLTARYPISPAEATELLERWAEEGKAIRVDGLEWADGSQWAERENLAEMRRATVAARRRESLSVSPEVFADFLLRWQHVHPVDPRRGSGVRRDRAPTTPGLRDAGEALGRRDPPASRRGLPTCLAG